MRSTFGALVATTLLISNAIAAPVSVAPLPSGKPAGVKQAATEGNNVLLMLLAAGIVIGGIALAVSGPGDNGVTTPTTSSTSTTGTAG